MFILSFLQIFFSFQRSLFTQSFLSLFLWTCQYHWCRPFACSPQDPVMTSDIAICVNCSQDFLINMTLCQATVTSTMLIFFSWTVHWVEKQLRVIEGPSPCLHPTLNNGNCQGCWWNNWLGPDDTVLSWLVLQSRSPHKQTTPENDELFFQAMQWLHRDN